MTAAGLAAPAAAPAKAALAAPGAASPVRATEGAAPLVPPGDAAPATLVPDAALAALWSALGITPALLAGRALRLHASAPVLVPAEPDEPPADPSSASPADAPAAAPPQRLLAPEAAAAWQAMRAAAAADGVALVLVSAFRSVERQAELIRQRLDAGEALAQVLALIAPPGCSEHHTGRAVDIGTPGQPLLEASFEATPAYAWLQRHAGRFGFTLSYPRGNAAGYACEPWHWCHDGTRPC